MTTLITRDMRQTLAYKVDVPSIVLLPFCIRECSCNSDSRWQRQQSSTNRLYAEHWWPVV